MTARFIVQASGAIEARVKRFDPSFPASAEALGNVAALGSSAGRREARAGLSSAKGQSDLRRN
jgi:hypothetical protein